VGGLRFRIAFGLWLLEDLGLGPSNVLGCEVADLGIFLIFNFLLKTKKNRRVRGSYIRPILQKSNLFLNKFDFVMWSNA
jgi:hypothetical protein